jgi:hypothetical protein
MNVGEVRRALKIAVYDVLYIGFYQNFFYFSNLLICDGASTFLSGFLCRAIR